MQPDTEQALYDRYVARRHAELPALIAAAERQDFEHLRRHGHNLLGSGSAYGIDRISRIGAQLERAAERHDRGGVTEALRALQSYLDGLRRGSG